MQSPLMQRITKKEHKTCKEQTNTANKIVQFTAKNHKMVTMIIGMARQKSQGQKGKNRPPKHKTFQSEYKHHRTFLNRILCECNGQEKFNF